MGSVQEAPGAERGEHVLQLHRTEREQLAGLTDWVRRGLDLGDKVICTEMPRRPADSLLAMLEARGVDVAAAVRDGRLSVLPVEVFYDAEGLAAVADRALAAGARPPSRTARWPRASPGCGCRPSSVRR